MLVTMSHMAKLPKSEMDTILSNFHRILQKVKQIIYIMYPNCMPDIMILAQAVLQILLYYTRCQSRTGDIIQSNTQGSMG